MTRATAARAVVLLFLMALIACRPLPFYEEVPIRTAQSWSFRDRYQAADHTINAFDFGHAILYETLLVHPGSADVRLEGKEYRFITGALLDDPPGLPLDEAAVGPRYVRLVPELRAMFEWAHELHRQVYDIWADSRVPNEKKDALVAAALRHYRSRADLAFSAAPKSMSLMEGQSYSLAFRRRCPNFNGLIWSYHWMQMVLYEALMAGGSDAERARNVASVLRQFRAMHAGAPNFLPAAMPLSAAIAPHFAERYPEAAIVFDNLHAMHDVVSDILASPAIPQSARRATILRAAARYRDDSTAVTTVAEWRDMARMMGADRMGGRWPPAPH